MKKSSFFIIIILITNICIAQEITYLEELPNDSDKYIIDITLGELNSLLTFVDLFEKDNIKVYMNNKQIFNENISTDSTLGAAIGVKFLKKSQFILIKINNYDEIKINNQEDYRCIYFFKKKNKYKIEYSKKPIKFY